MSKEIQQHLKWILLYEKTKDAGLTCRRCGISRPTLQKWLKRYRDYGIDGLENRSRRPLSSPLKKLNDELENIIKEMRSVRNLGARRIQTELIRIHSIKLSLATIHKTLQNLNVKPLVKPKRAKRYKRYNRPIPGDRVQMDVIKITNGLYQYTAVDDCTRYRVLGLFSRRTAKNTIRFLEQVVEEMPFPVQRIQTDRVVYI
jgi:transposase